jgi:hypothetical protein
MLSALDALPEVVEQESWKSASPAGESIFAEANSYPASLLLFSSVTITPPLFK